MRFRFWSKAKRLLTFACLLTSALCPAQVAGNSGQSNQPETPELPKVHAVASVPLPELWKKMGNTDRVGCKGDGDLLFELGTGELGDMPHEIARVGANGALLGYFDLRQSQGFEKATVEQATFDSAGKIVLLVANLLEAKVRSTDATGRPRAVTFHMDHTRWVLTTDDNGKILRKFSFKDSTVTGPKFALFKNGNVLVTGFVEESTGGVIFSPDGAVLAKVKVPALEADSASNADPAAARLRRLQLSPTFMVPIAGEDEIYLVHNGDEPFLVKVAVDGTHGTKVKLAIPEDERAHVLRIAGHRALAGIASAQKLPPGTITRAPDWIPTAVFDTESGALIETLLVPILESPVCYSGSGIKAIRTPEGTLDTLEK